MRTTDAERGGQPIRLTPLQIAEQRATGFRAKDAEQFLLTFIEARNAELHGHDTWRTWRDLLHNGNSVSIAGWIEGTAAAHVEGKRR